MMRIGELAKSCDCTVETVRYYEQKGLLDSPEREFNGYRQYRDAHRVQLNFIRHCRSLGMALSEIRVLHNFQANPERECDGINVLVDEQIERLHQQIHSLKLLEKQLKRLRETCQEKRNVSECGIIRNLALAAGSKISS